MLIDWQPWDSNAFAQAARERKPVLLSIAATWCGACHEMDRTTYADPEVATLVHERFVPVRVDAERRPDINDRYNLGGWPTTAFLTPEGGLITGGTFVAAAAMAGVLTRVAAEFARFAADGAERFAADRADVADNSASAADNADHAEGDAALIERIFASFDERYGGFGIEPKFPHTAPLHLATALFHDTGDPRWQRIVEQTLDAMANGPLWDAAAGGFFRYATARDWQLPHREKLLDTNAAILRVCAEAAIVFGRGADRDRCASIARFITATLRAEGGGYVGSVGDTALYADSNASAAAALLAAATVLGDDGLAREALASFERVLLLCYRPGAGLAHYYDGAARVRGLLVDHVAAVGALLDAHDASGGEPYRMMAEELCHVMIRDLWDAENGGFFDRVAGRDDVGLLRAQRKPFANAEAAIALDRAGFREHALGALCAAGRQLEGQGPLAAQYALARRQLID
jgi:uncharacterized protein YyaL (SSP411 family)